MKDTVTGEEYFPEELDVEVCKSQAGYYIGQLEPCGLPYSRLSEYYNSRKEAETALKIGFIVRGEENRQLLEKIKDYRRTLIESPPLPFMD